MGQSFIFSLFPLLIYVFYCNINFSRFSLFQLEVWIDESGIQSGLPAVCRYLKHVVFPGVNITAPYRFCTISKVLHILFVPLRSRHGYYFVFSSFYFWSGKFQHVLSLEVRKLPEHFCKLAYIGYLRYSAFYPVSGTFWLDLGNVLYLCKYGGPRIK